MKKLMTALAICATAGIVSATDPVTSANVVGYKQESSGDGVWIQPIQFAKVGSDNATACSLSEVLDFSTVATYDQLWAYDAVLGDYIQYEMRADGQWHDASNNQVVDIQVTPGNAMLLISGNTLTFAGQVPSITSYTQEFNGDGVYLLGSAIPAATTVASFNWSSSVSVYDQLWLYDAYLGDYIQYEWRPGGGTPGWFNAADNQRLPSTTPLDRGFLLITGASSLTQNL